MKYQLIKKIHLYASLSTAAVFIMFILTSYLMIHHSWFNHEKTESSEMIDGHVANEDDWQSFVGRHGIRGRLVQDSEDQEGNNFREYSSAAGSVRITTVADRNQTEIKKSHKSSTDALIGIHRQRGYDGPWPYLIYAFLLDLMGASLIVFAITGVIMWFKLLKYNRLAWIIFVGGLIYCLVTIYLLMYW